MTNERHFDAVAQLQALLSERSYSPEQIAETALHALYPTLSEGAANTYQRLGRGAVFMDLRDLVEGKLNTNYAPAAILERLDQTSGVFGEAVRAVEAYDPSREFVAVVWQEALIMTFRLKLV